MSAPKVRYAEVADNGIPTGGTAGQVLKKSSASDLDVEWGSSDAAANGIPAGGTTGQIPAKASDADYDVAWTDAPSASNGLPIGGTAGQVLKKKSAADYDADWEDEDSNRLFAKFTFDSLTGTTVKNEAKYNLDRNNAIMTNVTYDTGLINNAAIFSGSGYGIVQRSADILRDTYSIVLWFKTTDHSQNGSGVNRRMVANTNGNAANLTLFMEFDGTMGKISFGTYDTTWRTVLTNNDYCDGNWHMAVGIVNTAEKTVGLNMDNGDEIVSNTLGASVLATVNADLYIGKAGTNSYGYYIGLMDSVRIYTKALSSAEISALYNGGAGI